MKTTQMRTSKGYLFRVCYSKKLATVMHLADIDNRKLMGKFYCGEKKERLQVCSDLEAVSTGKGRGWWWVVLVN